MNLNIIHDLAGKYAGQFSTAEDEALKKISENTLDQAGNVQMLSGHVQGKFLEILSKIIQPKAILEIGTFTGYSATCLARGLAEKGKLHTIESNEEHARLAQHSFQAAGVNDRIVLHIGNALTIIPTLNKQWDLVFIDADKVNYTKYYQLVWPNVKSGGVIIADNVLFHGEVLKEPVTGKNAKAIHEFNEYVRKDEKVEKVLLTIRDGLLLIRKK